MIYILLNLKLANQHPFWKYMTPDIHNQDLIHQLQNRTPSKLHIDSGPSDSDTTDLTQMSGTCKTSYEFETNAIERTPWCRSLCCEAFCRHAMYPIEVSIKLDERPGLFQEASIRIENIIKKISTYKTPQRVPTKGILQVDEKSSHEELDTVPKGAHMCTHMCEQCDHVWSSACNL